MVLSRRAGYSNGWLDLNYRCLISTWDLLVIVFLYISSTCELIWFLIMITSTWPISACCRICLLIVPFVIQYAFFGASNSISYAILLLISACMKEFIGLRGFPALIHQCLFHRDPADLVHRCSCEPDWEVLCFLDWYLYSDMTDIVLEVVLHGVPSRKGRLDDIAMIDSISKADTAYQTSDHYLSVARTRLHDWN